MDCIITAKKSQEMMTYLLGRRSCKIQNLKEPGPDKEQIRTMLKAAARVPDHGKLFPWYFIVFEGENREKTADLLKNAWLAEHPDTPPAKLELEAARFTRAPLVIAVVSRIREGKHPVWEQILSAGAACQNLCLAANALGFATNWLTEWYSYSPAFRQSLGLDPEDHIVGFIYIGTPAEMPEERPRPDIDEITTWWEPNAALRKGAEYGQAGKGYPRKGFDFSALYDDGSKTS